MNHQVQGMVLVDNEWVSRPVDVYQIMAQSRQDDAEIQEPPTKTTPNAHNPQYGLLSRTVLPTPLYKFILPANIRHRDFNDVVLVGEDSIQLNEIYGYGRLRNVAVKSDFSGRILAARVFGESREIRVNTSVGSPQPGIADIDVPMGPTQRKWHGCVPTQGGQASCKLITFRPPRSVPCRGSQAPRHGRGCIRRAIHTVQDEINADVAR
jgi:hypothetical protein